MYLSQDAIYTLYQLSPVKPIGLVPAAVGATSLAQWMPWYYNCSVYNFTDNRVPTVSPSRIAWPICTADTLVQSSPKNVYISGCMNILSCALHSIYICALTRFEYICRQIDRGELEFSYLENELCTIGGVAWYQGCNDASESEIVAGTLYPIRFANFVSYLRSALKVIIESAKQIACQKFHIYASATGCIMRQGAGCMIPVVTVAITSTRKMLMNQKLIRQYQLYGSRSHVPLLAVVDAHGALLQQDSIHLKTGSYLVIGYLMAKQMIALQNEMYVAMQPRASAEKGDEGKTDETVFNRSYLVLNDAVPVLKYSLGSTHDIAKECIFLLAMQEAHEELNANDGYMKASFEIATVFPLGLYFPLSCYSFFSHSMS